MTARRVPVWLEAIELDGWATLAVDVPSVRCSLSPPVTWDGPATSDGEVVSTVRWRGPSLAESLAVTLITNADPTLGLEEGHRANAVLTGLPFALDARIDEAELLELLPVRSNDDLLAIAEVFTVDEAATSTGVVAVSLPEVVLMRFYVLSARRGEEAWSVTLTFETACLPGTPPERVDANDHVRAGATLGSASFGAR